METATQLGIVHTQRVCFSSKLAVKEVWCIICLQGKDVQMTVDVDKTTHKSCEVENPTPDIDDVQMEWSWLQKYFIFLTSN